MPRPTSKAELLEAATGQFGKLCGLVESMTDAERASQFDFSSDARKKEAHWGRDACLRDVLVHLHEWHELVLVWVAANRAGEPRPFFPEPYTWKTYGQLNVEFWRRHQSTSLADAERLLRASHEQVLALIQELSDEELFEKRRFSWTGTSTLGSYCVSATSSHYEWAMKKIRAHLKTIRSN